LGPIFGPRLMQR